MVPPEEQIEFAKQAKLTYPLFMWEQEKLPQMLHVIISYPTTLLIDRNGKIREVVFGILFGERKENLERKLLAVLKEKPKAKGKASLQPK